MFETNIYLVYWLECGIYKIFFCKTKDQLFTIVYDFNPYMITSLP